MKPKKAKRTAKLSEVFRLAREYMEEYPDDCSKFICTNINVLYNMGVITETVRWKAKDVINTRLGGRPTVEGWLCVNKHITPYQYNRANDFANTPMVKRVREYRLAWLRELEREFKAKGK